MQGRWAHPGPGPTAGPCLGHPCGCARPLCCGPERKNLLPDALISGLIIPAPAGSYSSRQGMSGACPLCPPGSFSSDAGNRCVGWVHGWAGGWGLKPCLSSRACARLAAARLHSLQLAGLAQTATGGMPMIQSHMPQLVHNNIGGCAPGCRAACATCATLASTRTATTLPAARPAQRAPTTSLPAARR